MLSYHGVHLWIISFCHVRTFLSVTQFHSIVSICPDLWDLGILSEIAALFYLCYLYPAVSGNHSFSIFLNVLLSVSVSHKLQVVPSVVKECWELDSVVASQLPQKAYMP